MPRSMARSATGRKREVLGELGGLSAVADPRLGAVATRQGPAQADPRFGAMLAPQQAPLPPALGAGHAASPGTWPRARPRSQGAVGGAQALELPSRPMSPQQTWAEAGEGRLEDGTCGAVEGASSGPWKLQTKRLKQPSMGEQVVSPHRRGKMLLHRVSSDFGRPARPQAWTASVVGSSVSKDQLKDLAAALLPAATRQAGLRDEPLSPSELFDAVIRRDKTFGDLLFEIKAAYESFLLDHDVPLPVNPLPVPEVKQQPRKSRISLVAAMSLSDLFSLNDNDEDDFKPSEMAVDAARRPWIDLQEGSPSQERQVKKAHQLERENEALRLLVERLQAEVDEHGGEEGGGT